ncbi:MAG: methanol dehydrogenase [Prochlorococcus sp.]
MKSVILILIATIATVFFVLNPRMVFDHGRPIYLVSCRMEWSAHWLGAFGKGGLLGVYSLDSAAQAVVSSTPVEYVSKDEQMTIAMSTVMKPCR